MCRLKTISRPYAKAAFSVAVEQKNIIHWQYMLEFICEMYKNKYAKYFIFTHSLSNALILMYIKKICKENIDNYFENFLKVIIENKRLNTLPYILNYFIKLSNQNKSIKVIKITSATLLDVNQINRIQVSLEKKFLCKIKINFKIDKNIISGLKIYLGNKVFDGSIRNRVNQLIDILKNN